MEDAETPAWYSIVHFISSLLVIGILSFVNSIVEHKRPVKKYKERPYRYSPGNDNKNETTTIAVTDSIQNNDVIIDVPNDTIPKSNSVDKLDLPKTDKEYFSELVDNYVKTVLANLERPESRSDVVIRYYSKPKDNGEIYTLRRYGFYIHEKPSDPSYDQFVTNTLYFGDAVKNEDIQLVAYVLTKAGVKLKQIKPSRLHDDWKANAIEIGTDSTALELPYLKFADIRKNWH